MELTKQEERDLNLICKAYYDLFDNPIKNPFHRKPIGKKIIAWLKNYHENE
jgi:hypothetical protein